MEYESVIQEVLLRIELVLKMLNKYNMRSFIFVVSGLKIFCHVNTDNNLESLRI
jgi:hypothetical protein